MQERVGHAARMERVAKRLALRTLGQGTGQNAVGKGGGAGHRADTTESFPKEVERHTGCSQEDRG